MKIRPAAVRVVHVVVVQVAIGVHVEPVSVVVVEVVRRKRPSRKANTRTTPFLRYIPRLIYLF